MVARALPLLGLLLLVGCAVPQPRGAGKLQRLVEPTTRRHYWLYLPSEYVQTDDAGRAARRWPVVVSFHGMKPADVAKSQAREWQQEADRYGYVVIAPELKAFDLFFGEFPLRHLNRAFKSDEAAVIAVLDHVFQTTQADPSNVLTTSWSSGGYMAHYMLNRYPERFTCLAVRQSNFSSEVLDPSATPRSLYRPVLIVSTQNDIAICKEESREAIQWYQRYGYKNLAWVYLNKLGHERTPDIAADFFSRVCGAKPNRPPEVLVSRQAIDGNPTGIALLRGDLGLEQPPEVAAAPVRPRPSVSSPAPAVAAATPSGPVYAPPRERAAEMRPRPTPRNAATEPRATLLAPAPSGTAQGGGPSASRLPPATGRAATGAPPGEGTAQRGARSPAAPATEPVAIRVSSAIGYEPLLLVFSADCPVDWHRTADFYWTLDGKRIGHGINGQKTITGPGDYKLELLVVTEDGGEHRAEHPIRVLRNTSASARGS